METTTLVLTLAFLTLLVVLGVGLVSKVRTQGSLHDRDDVKSPLTTDGADRQN